MEAPALATPIELLHVADAVAREKSINREEVIVAMEVGIQKAARAKYGPEYDIRATIDRRTGEITLQRFTEVVDHEIEDEAKQILVADAQRLKKGITAGEFIIDTLPPINFGRIAAQVARQIISQNIKQAERKREYEEFKERAGEIVHGVIKRADFGNYVIDLGGRAEGFLRRDEVIPRENLRQGDRVRAYIFDVREETHAPQILVSRTHPQFLAKLFAQEVPEIYEGVIEVKSVARDPGSRAKIAVFSNDRSIDPVGACVGLRGSRVQAVVNELQGEKIDIIPWTEDYGIFVANALQPAQVAKVVVDEDNKKIEVVVPEEQLSLAIGRRGQNVRLASILVGWDIDVLTEDEEAKRRTDEFKQRSELFIEALDVEDVIAHLLVAEGFTSVQDVAFVPTEELAAIEGFDADVAEALQDRAKAYLDAAEKAYKDKVKALKIDASLEAIEVLNRDMIVKLGEADVKSSDDLADLASDELLEILGEGAMSKSQANRLIMDLRSAWFEDEEESEEKK